MSRLVVVAALALLFSAGSVEGAANRLPEPPLSVLIITGGGYHDFAGNLPLLLRGINADGLFTFSLLRRGPGPFPKGVPDATVGLDDPLLRERVDVILAYSQGDLGLTEAERAGLIAFVEGGGGLVALHSAADSHPGWEAWTRLVGGRFETHPPFGEVTVDVTGGGHPIVEHAPPSWTLADEFYHLRDCPTDDKTLLMEGTSPAGGAPRPVSWVRHPGSGRVFYTILGHGPTTHADARFQDLVRRALAWAARAPRPAADGTWVLFDGQGLEGWRMAGPGSFEVVDGCLEARGGMGLLWWAARPFRDFVLTLEWKTTRPEDNSGVFVRFPRPSNDPWTAVREGYEIQICDSTGPGHRTGSVYSFQDAEALASHPPGTWNRYEIMVRGQEYRIQLNGREVCRFHGARGRQGYVGLQNHDDASPVRFRNIRVRELP